MKLTRGILVVPVAALALAACGNHGTPQSAASVEAKASAAAAAPQAQAAQQAAQRQVANCLPKGNLLTTAGRQAILNCVAPPAQQAALKQCVATAAGHEHLATKPGRAKLEQQDVPNCLVTVQRGAPK